MPALISLSLLFAVGIIISPQLPLTWWLILGLAGLVVGFLAAARNKRQLVSVAILLLAFVAGALRLSLVSVQPDQMASLNDRIVTVEGIVVREGESTFAGITYILATQRIGEAELQPASGQVLLRDLRPAGETYFYGDLIRVRGKLVKPQGAANFGQFDYRAYLERRGIKYQLAVTSPEDIRRLGENRGNPLVAYLLEARERYLQVIDVLPSLDAALLKALTLGERSMLAPEIVDFFTASGTVHLMAVSGVHVGIVAALVLGLGRLLRFPFWLQGLAAGLIVIVYVVWTGLTASAMRAGIMFLLGLLGALTGRKRNSLVALAAAAGILLLINPLNLYDTGFQLSFAAAAGILYLVPIMMNTIHLKLKRWVAPFLTTVAAQLGTWPLTAYYFSGVSVVGFIASFFAIPLASLALILGLLGLLVGAWYLPVGQVLLGAAGLALVVLTFVARLFAQLPGAFVHMKRPPVVFMIVYYVLLFAAPFFFQATKEKGRWRRIFVVVVALCLLAFCWRGSVSPVLTVDFLAVGQGDAILVKSPSGQAVLIDTGQRHNFGGTVWDAGEKILLPYLRSQGIHRLELVFFTHGDTDHVGGGPAILNALPVGAAIIPATFGGGGADLIKKEAVERGIPLYPATNGLKVDLGSDVHVTVLSPPAESISSDNPDNDNSLVLYLSYGNSGFLFTGDAGWPAEQYLLKCGFPGPVHVLKVAHHGAVTGTTDEFLAKIKPELAIISVGKNNFGHPSPQTMERLVSNGVEVLRTDQAGQVRIESDGRMLQVKTFAGQRGYR
jgi:competence protein ComEC